MSVKFIVKFVYRWEIRNISRVIVNLLNILKCLKSLLVMVGNMKSPLCPPPPS